MSLVSFARLLGLRSGDAEPALHSERVAKLVLSRRSFIGASAALAAASQFSFAVPEPLSSLHLVDGQGNILQRWLPGERVRHFSVFGSQLAMSEGQPYGVAILRRVGISMPLYQCAIHPQAAVTWIAHAFENEFVA